MGIGSSLYALAVLGEGSSAQIASGDKAGSGTGVADLDGEGNLLRTRATTSTSLRFPVGPTETTIPVASTAGFAADGAVTIDGECITYLGTTATAFTGCTRGAFQQDGHGAAAAHEIGTPVFLPLLATHHRVLADAVIAVQGRVESLLVDASVNVQTGTSYTLAAADRGRLVLCGNANPVTVTVPAGLPAGFRCRIAQTGAGQVTVGGASTTRRNRQSHAKTAGQWAVVELEAIGTNEYLLTGDTGA